MVPEIAFDDWLLAAFVGDGDDTPSPSARQSLTHLTRLFADPVTSLADYGDDDIAAGLWRLLAYGDITVGVVGDITLPLADRTACVAAISTVYRDLFLPRCSEGLGRLSEQQSELDGACYMFWDIADIGGAPGTRDGTLLEDAVLEVLEHALGLPHAACQESAVHGLGHRVDRHPRRAPEILDRWRRTGRARDPRLDAYAAAAGSGCIQ